MRRIARFGSLYEEWRPVLFELVFVAACGEHRRCPYLAPAGRGLFVFPGQAAWALRNRRAVSCIIELVFAPFRGEHRQCSPLPTKPRGEHRILSPRLRGLFVLPRLRGLFIERKSGALHYRTGVPPRLWRALGQKLSPRWTGGFLYSPVRLPRYCEGPIIGGLC
jgi:hypothetical protein